jgi:hypothetical protein
MVLQYNGLMRNELQFDDNATKYMYFLLCTAVLVLYKEPCFPPKFLRWYRVLQYYYSYTGVHCGGVVQYQVQLYQGHPVTHLRQIQTRL